MVKNIIQHYRHIFITIILSLSLLSTIVLMNQLKYKSKRNQNYQNFYPPKNPYSIYDNNNHFGIYDRYIPYDYNLPEYIEHVQGLYPNIINLAVDAIISVNATCGETGPEYYCLLVSHNINSTDCNVCDASNPDYSKRHPIKNAIDGTENWWQSPSLKNGKRYEWITININLRQVYEIAYVIIKSAISPLPSNWILERSIDGINYYPWQYFAQTDTECWERYRVRPSIGKLRYRTDDEVICTSMYSKNNVIAHEEIDISLINGRPGVETPDGISPTLREFIKAQHIRIRMQKIRTLKGNYFYDPNDIDKSDSTLTNRLFYSIKDISIGGMCSCNGHAKECQAPDMPNAVAIPNRGLTIHPLPKCNCQHNTCGRSCETCCPMFNQKKWRPGTKRDGFPCEECQCHGHADECYYDQTVADKKLSINKEGNYEGGGVCVRCKHHTTGINCEQCEDGYYRPEDIEIENERPCQRCQCNGPGMNKLCVKDDSHQIEGRHPGDCLCREGFEGPRCDRCAQGYRNYPRCEQCTCVNAGIINSKVCDGNCICKPNVIGHRCNKCKEGYYNLAADNPDGCSQCYCFGATNVCKPSDWGIEVIKSTERWRVTDVPGSFKLEPVVEDGHYEIADDYIPDRAQNLYFWEAPSEYLGQNLYTYGNALKYIVRYVIVRGDTSGVYTDEPDVILEGGPDSSRYGFRWQKRPEDSDEDEFNSTIILPLREQNWFRVDDNGREIPDSQPSRQDFALLLNDLKRLLIRAKYHTDQVSGGLYQTDLEKASNSSASIKKAVGTEQCDCPPGYAGLSCEYCEPGYRRVNNVLVNGVCEKCNCNNHAESCDPYTGVCSECLHNTTGPTCGECKPGFYGDATRGREDDCKPCACPLLIPSNNFSPTCRLESSAKYGYICLECPEGYTGERCELCANGYFGNPLIPGGFCAPCDCGPNANTTVEGYCDRLTGQCKYCLENFGGWKCDECLPDHWGNAAIGDCKACNCDIQGSVSTQCNPTTGQCECKPNYTGVRCDHCAPGYGNIELGCISCNCNMTGSMDQFCDEVTGQCHCKQGVFGQHCDKCLEGHFGFSNNGCEWCNCNKLGSEGPDCDEFTGQCICKPFVIGRDCSRCEPGFWNLVSNKGCEPCNCNITGSYSNVCNEMTGQCECKPGVGGLHCDQCLPGYYGFGPNGCAACEPCTAPGHICDSKTGKCVCPPNTAGPTCNDCAPGTWGFDVLAGCQTCDCNLQGSVNNECNHKTGECVCLDGFEGMHCEKCKFGYYRFPNCRRCDCHEPGTDPSSCREDGLCQCDESGQCPCKQNVAGRRCDVCKEGTFGLAADNPLGCFQCFCFGKSGQCDQSRMVWTEHNYPQREAYFVIGSTEIRSVLGFKVIPPDTSSVGVKNFGELQQSFYWSMPTEMLNDQVATYNGLIRFRTYGRGGGKLNEVLRKRFPLVVLQGNHRIILYHYGPEQLSPTGLYRVRLHETEWTLADNPEYPVTRDVLMVALQKVQHILIRASDLIEANFVRISDVSVDVATLGGFSSKLAAGIEQCQCPPQYAEASCQDPNIGYCRKRKQNYLDSKDILDLVGWAEPCNCHNYSRICDKETCECLNCEAFTGGPYCNQCIRGYYGDPTRAIPCRKCACPTLVNSFSETCELLPGSNSEYVCTDCQVGYTGRHCEQCADGYWGDPMAPDGKCVPCNCSPIGSLSNICDKRTGQCPCKEGITGHDCGNCPPRHVVTDTGCLNCDDDCTGTLLDDIEFLQSILQEANLTDVENLPWTRLMYLTKKFNITNSRMNQFKERVMNGKKMVRDFTVDFDLETLANLLNLEAKDLSRKAPYEAEKARDTVNRAQDMKDRISDLWEKIQNIINQLKHHLVDSTDPYGTAADRMYEEAVRILQELRMTDFSPDNRKGDIELKKAQYLLERVLLLLTERGDTRPMQDRISKLLRLLNEIYEMINRKVYPETREAQRIVNSIRPLLQAIFDARDNAVQNGEAAHIALNEARELLDLIHRELFDTKIKFNDLADLIGQMNELTDEIEKRRSILARLNPEYEEKYVKPCEDHAAELMRRVNELGRLFNQTRNVAGSPLQAANVYENIVKALTEAEEAVANARAAAEKAFYEANPDDDDSLLQKAIEARKRSEELLKEADDLNKRLRDLQYEIAQKQRMLVEIEAMIDAARQDLDWINKSLDQLPRGLGNEVRLINDRLQSLLDNLANSHKRLDEMMIRIFTLEQDLEKLSSGPKADLDDIKRDITQSLNLLKRLKEEIVKIESKGPGLQRHQQQFDLNLDELKAKIKLARQKAASIRVSLGADREGVCIRTYEPDIEPSFTNNIVMYYAIKHEHIRDSLLLYLGARESQGYNNDFMSIEMVNRQIRFIWSTGNNERMITHPLNILTNDASLSKDSHWYKIEVKRYGSTANLSVLSVPGARFQDPLEMSVSSNSESKQMNLDRNSYFYIGGLPTEIPQIPRQLQSRSFGGCLFEVYLDGKRVGLWNFTSNIGCDGCMEGATEPIDPNMYTFFDEFAYGKTRQISNYNRDRYLVSMHFRTFDENALLFFTSNPRTRDYVAIYLKDGHVHYECHFGSGIGRPGLLQSIVTDEKLNTGKWVNLRAERERDEAVLEFVMDSQKKNYEKTLQSSGRSTDLDLAGSDVYFGGVTPNFTLISDLEYPNVVFRSFVGCMNSPQIEAVPINFQRIQSFGIEPGCMEKPIRVASFFGEGYLELDGQPLTDHAEFSFTFKTPRPHGVLLLSTFEGLPRSYERKDDHYYFFYIYNGTLEVRLNGGGGVSSYRFDNMNVSDGKYHTVTCIKDMRRFRILIDDEHESTQLRLAKSRVIEAPKKGGLFIGGTPPGFTVINKGYSSNFYGVIRDIVFNSKLISFNNPASFRGVGIGHEGSFEIIHPTPSESYDDLQQSTWRTSNRIRAPMF
ncbi:Laminin subunit alpha-2 [Dermatophagoides pteronyssinus]|uniref:Laminin subunit alpha-2 n=1 Tax=Dermatophagoides pteronyssinus TaxID=6956 RepID=A0ABQ8JCE2_DERPT|nr:Laminin subunit alpha-2 [Dermatophagoides pteronyssinus]